MEEQKKRAGAEEETRRKSPPIEQASENLKQATAFFRFNFWSMRKNLSHYYFVLDLLLKEIGEKRGLYLRLAKSAVLLGEKKGLRDGAMWHRISGWVGVPESQSPHSLHFSPRKERARVSCTSWRRDFNSKLNLPLAIFCVLGLCFRHKLLVRASSAFLKTYPPILCGSLLPPTWLFY